MIGLFPKMTEKEDEDRFLEPITLHEVEAVLKGFKKDKSPGLDGWPVEFFLDFFDLVGEDLVLAVEQAKIDGKVPGALNSTFLSLIPKCENPTTFVDFRPISLCNLVYKVISKIVALPLKPLLNRTISAQQLGFLKDRQITEPVGITQEILHSIKTKNSNVMVLKLDLVKAFDRVNWTFLRLPLLQIGLPLIGVNWIMGCVTNACFVVLVNGTPFDFFPASRGIRQGCPLSPLLFILVIESLSRIILDAQLKERIKGF